MDENNAQNNEQINAEEIKKEAQETVKEVKEAVKNADIKKEVNAVTDFFKNFFKNPIGKIDNVAKSSKNQFLKLAIIILVVWLVADFIGAVVNVFQSYSLVSSLYSSFGTFLKNSVNNVFSVIKTVVTPFISLALLCGIIYVVTKNSKKPFMNVVYSVVVAKIPVVLATVVGLLDIFGSQVYKIVNPFTSFCSILSTVLVYFAIKSLSDEKDDNSAIKKFAIVMGIFYIVKFVVSFFGLYI